MGERADEVNSAYGAEVYNPEVDQVKFVVLSGDTTKNSDSGTEQNTEVIRADIDQTRTEMSQTIDAIQEKLNPQQIMEQAKATVMETATGLMDHAKEAAVEAVDHAKEAAAETVGHAKEAAAETVGHVKEAATETVDHTKQTVHDATVGKVEHMVSNITDTAQETGSGIVGMIKSNPIPSALIGLGLGWLYMKNQNKGNNNTPSYPNQNQYRGYAGQSSYSSNQPYGYPSQARISNPYSSQRDVYAPSNGTANASGKTESVVNRIVETVQQNPLPAALTGIGIGYLVMQGQGSNKPTSNYSSYGSQQPGLGQKVGDVAGQAGDKVSNLASGVGDKVGDVTHKAGDLVGQAGGKVGDIAGGVGDTLGNVAGGVGDTLGNVVGGVGDTLGNVAGGVGGTIGTVAGGVGGTIGNVAGGVGGTIGNVVGGVGDTIGGVATGVQYQAQEAQTLFSLWLEEKPLAIGAVAMALGITAGLLLPNTPQENKLLGQAHDTFIEKVQETTQQTLEKVQHVTEEVGHTAKNAVEEISTTASKEAHNQGLVQ